MSIMSKFLGDSKKAEDGVVFDLGEFDPDLKWEYEGKQYSPIFYVRKSGSKKSEELASRLYAAASKKGKKRISVNAEKEILCEIVARELIVRWENFEEERPEYRDAAIEEHGVPFLAYDMQTCKTMMIQIPQLAEMVSGFAQDATNFPFESSVNKQAGKDWPGVTGQSSKPTTKS